MAQLAKLSTLLCGLTLVSAFVQAQPTELAPTHAKYWLTASIASHHTSQAAQFNQHNAGLGFEISFLNKYVERTRWVGGRFKNSDGEHSHYLGVQAMPIAINRSGNLRAGAMLGVINGYTRVQNGGPFPLLAPMLSYETALSSAAVGANLFVIPPVAGIPLTFALQLKVGF